MKNVICNSLFLSETWYFVRKKWSVGLDLMHLELTGLWKVGIVYQNFVFLQLLLEQTQLYRSYVMCYESADQL